MELGIFLSYMASTEDQNDGLYDRMLEQGVAADRAGFGHVWVPEHHLVQYMAAPSALMTAVQLSQHVSCRVGTAVIVLPYHQPIQLAGEIALADQILKGRLDLGVARGAWRYEFEILGTDFDTSLQQFIENLEAIRALLSEEEKSTSFAGDHVNFSGAYVWPRPVQKPYPPLWMATNRPIAIEDAAARGYSVLTTMWFRDDDEVAEMVEAFQRGKARANSDQEQKFGMTRYACAVDDESEIEQRLLDIRQGHRIQVALHNFEQNADDRGVVQSLPYEDEPSLEEMESVLLVGTADTIRTKLQRLQDIGVDVVNVNTGLAPPDKAIRSIELLGEAWHELAAKTK